MSDKTTQLVERSTQSSGSADGASNARFFERYSKVRALTKPTRKSGEAIKLFYRSELELASSLANWYSRGRSGQGAGAQLDLEEISILHANLALIHWLYPNHIGYNRTKNAKVMYQHAVAATSTSRSRTDIAGIIGLAVQLRILPFLIKSKSETVEALSSVRLRVGEIASGLSNNSLKESGPPGLLSDALGFSYFLQERDTDTAITYLTRACTLLAEAERTITGKQSRMRSSDTNAKTLFFRAFASASFWDLGICYEDKAEKTEGEEMLAFLRKSRAAYQTSFELSKGTSWNIYKAMSAYNLSGTYFKEAQFQFEKRKAVALLKKSLDLGEESLHWFNLWSKFEGDFLGGSWIASFYQHLANYSDAKSKKKLMARSLELAERAERLVENKKVGLARYKAVNLGDIFYHYSEYYRQLAIESIQKKNATSAFELLKKALASCTKSRIYYSGEPFVNRRIDESILAGDICYNLMNCSSETQVSLLDYSSKAKRNFNNALKISKKYGFNEKSAETNWRIAQVFDREGNYQKSSSSYMLAHESYELASEHSSVYADPSIYMLAWHNVEKAKMAHRSSSFQDASSFYETAFQLIQKTDRWRPRSHLYSAESFIELAEKESVADRTIPALEYFEKAIRSLDELLSQLKKFEQDQGTSDPFLNLGKRLKQFCTARMILERSKESYRQGDALQSVRRLSHAEKIFSQLAKQSIFSVSDSLESNELDSLSRLCEALRNFQLAQINDDPDLYLRAKDVFSKASEESKSKALGPLLAGLSNFASFLYYSKQIAKSIDSTLDMQQLVECDKALDSAESMFRKLGNTSAFLSMLKASKSILDATIKMSAAEREVEDGLVKAKLYSQAQRSLSIASRYYQRLGSSKRVRDSLKMISTVKQHKALIPLAHDIIAEVASNQIIYSAMSSTSILEESPENSARELDSAYLAFDLGASKSLVACDEKIALSVTLSNMGKEEALAVRIDSAFPAEFEMLDSKYTRSDDSLVLGSGLKIGPRSTKTIVLSVKASSPGEFVWHPSLIYMDASKNHRISRAKAAKVVVEPDNATEAVLAALERKRTLEEELERVGATSSSSEDRMYELREDISRAEESIARAKNQYTKLNSELDQVRADIASLKSENSTTTNADDLKALEDEEKLLLLRIEKRRLALEAGHLL